MNAALKENEMAAAAPNQAERHGREPRRRVQARQARTAPEQAHDHDHPAARGRKGGPAPGVGHGEEARQARHGQHGAYRLAPTERRAEPDAQDEHEEDELADHERLDDAQSPEAQSGGLEAERADHGGESHVPDRPAHDVAEELQATALVFRGGLDSEPLEDRREGVAKRRARPRAGSLARALST